MGACIPPNVVNLGSAKLSSLTRLLGLPPGGYTLHEMQDPDPDPRVLGSVSVDFKSAEAAAGLLLSP